MNSAITAAFSLSSPACCLKHYCVCSDHFSVPFCSLLCSEVYTGPDFKRALNLTFDSYCDVNLTLSLSCTALVCHIRLLPWELWICAILRLVLLLHILTRYGPHICRGPTLSVLTSCLSSSLMLTSCWELLAPVFRIVCVCVCLCVIVP